MKKMTLLLSCLLAITSVYASQRSRQEAFEKAQQFMQGKKLLKSSQSQRPDRLKSQSALPNQSFKNLYIFNAESNGGFVIVSADDRTQAILGYANRGELDVQKMPCNVQWLLNYYETAITQLGSSSATASRNITRSSDGRSFIPVLLNTQWGQNEPYNDLCPLQEGSRCVTGCLATAMGQMMNYYHWPQDEIAPVPAYTTASNSIAMPELPAIQFDWNNMTNTAIAQLMLYCGQAVQMDYGLWGSSAYNHMASRALVDVFGYNKDAKFVSRDNYASDQWTKMLDDELQQGHPVIYFGQSLSNGGHAFIVDGYVDGMYHINWGWDGYCDGFFTLDGLNPEMEDGYNFHQEMVINICPPEKADDYTPPTTTYFPRKIVMEEATGTWCGYCPYGMAAIEFMNKQYPDNFIAIAIHDDEMTPTDSYSPFLSQVTAFPSSRINRSYWLYPQPFNLDGTKDLGVAMIKANAEFTPGNQVEVSTETVFGFSDNSTEYRIAYVVVEDNVGPYQQSNYLSNPSAADNPNDLMNWWVHQGPYVETTYNDVARAIYDYDGVVGQLPRTVTEGETYQCKYTLTLPENVKNAENVKIVTLLINTSTGEIINADRTTISGEYVAPTYFPRKIVMEEATGTWCGYCPYGMAAIEYMNKQYPDNFIAIAIHDDEMTPTDSYYPFLSQVTAFPSSRINRSYWLYPQPFNLNDMKDRGVAMIKADAGFTSGNQVEVSTETVFAFSDNSTEYRIAYVVVEDNVGPYQQSNYLSDPSAADNPNDLMNWWVHQGPYVETTYNDVARAIYDYDGVVGQLPRTITEGETYQCKYTLTLPGNVKNAENVKIVTLLIDTSTGEIINADRTTISGKQEPTTPTDNIVFADNKVKALCVGKWDANGDGELSKEEAAAVTSLENSFMENTEIVSFDELQYFTGLSTLGEEEFSGCENLSSIILPNTIVTIEGNAFYDCYALTNITLPASVKKLADAAFVGCTGLTTITIPAKVEEVGYGVFIGCSKLKSIEVDAENPHYQSVDGVLYTKEEGRRELIAYPDNKEGTSYTVIDGTYEIHAFSFAYSKLTELTLPESIYGGIGVYAFGFNTALRTINSYIKEGIDGGMRNEVFSEEVYQNATLYVPKGWKERYQATAGWNKFVHIEEMKDGDSDDPKDGIAIDEVNFPDENFRNYLLAQEYGADGVLTDMEIEEITEIYIVGRNVGSFKGIEHFKALEVLWCHNNHITTLDISQNTALTSLSCGGNQLTALDVSQNTKLTWLHCSPNLLTALDVSNNTELTSIDCFGNQIKGVAMDAFINSLPQTDKGGLYIYDDMYSNEGNVCTKSHVALAKAKGWTSYYRIGDAVWGIYEGSDDVIDSIDLPEIENGDAPIYTLQGQKVTKPMKGGIYVINGKKVVVK